MLLLCLVLLRNGLYSDVIADVGSQKDCKNIILSGADTECPFMDRFGGQCYGLPMIIDWGGLSGVQKMRCTYGHIWLQKDGYLVTPYPRINP